MGSISCLLQGVAAVGEDIPTEPAFDEILPVRVLQLANGSELERITDYHEMGFGTIGCYHHCRWWCHRTFIDNDHIPLLLQQLGIQVERGQGRSDNGCILDYHTSRFVLCVNDLLIESGQSLLQQNNVLGPTFYFLLHQCNMRIAS